MSLSHLGVLGHGRCSAPLASKRPQGHHRCPGQRRISTGNRTSHATPVALLQIAVRRVAMPAEPFRWNAEKIEEPVGLALPSNRKSASATYRRHFAAQRVTRQVEQVVVMQHLDLPPATTCVWLRASKRGQLTLYGYRHRRTDTNDPLLIHYPVVGILITRDSRAEVFMVGAPVATPCTRFSEHERDGDVARLTAVACAARRSGCMVAGVSRAATCGASKSSSNLPSLRHDGVTKRFGQLPAPCRAAHQSADRSSGTLH